jgi:maleylacetoacetate isomerase
MLRLYGFWRSSATYRVRIALALKKLRYDYVPVHLARGGGEQFRTEFLQLNPQARVPTLEVDGAVLTQSMAILEWLEEAYPSPALLPVEPLSRARVRSLALVVVADIQPLQNTAVVKYLREHAGFGDREAGAWYEEWIGRGLRALETRLAADAATGRFCHADFPTLADVCLVPQCYAARRFAVDMTQFPVISRIERACNELAAFQAAAPERQPDAET